MSDLPTLPTFEDLTAEFSAACTSRKAQELVAYWRSKGGGEVLPSWADIKLIEIYRLAPWVMVKEAVDDGREWRNRYFGTSLASELGVEATNKLLAAYHAPEEVPRLIQFFGAIRQARSPARVFGRCIVQHRTYKTLEGIYLPLAEASSKVSMIMGLEDYQDIARA